MILIGLVGEKGGGKETFGKVLAELLPDKTFATVRVSDILREVLAVLDVEPTREALQDCSIMLDGEFGDGTVSNAVRARIISLNADIIFIDGVRWHTDVELLRSIGNNILVYITADEKTRFERLKARKEKAGEAEMDWKQFQHEEKKKTEIYIKEIGATADYIIENNGTLEEFKKNIQKFSQEKL